MIGGPPLEDDFWHVTKYYENIRTKLRNMPESAGECSKIADSLPERICRVPLKVRIVNKMQKLKRRFSNCSKHAVFHRARHNTLLGPIPRRQAL